MSTTRSFALHALLLLGLTALHARAAAEPPAGKWQPEEFPIGFWVGPPPALNTLKAYRMMKDCGFTVATTSIGYTKADNLKMLDHCQTAGLKALVGFHEQMIPAWPKGDGWDAIAETGVQDYASHPALGGWALLDEPRADTFPGLATMNRTFGGRTPGKLRFINLFPNYATPEQLGTKNYQEYLDTFLTTVKPDVLCYDHYALMKDGSLRPDYFQNLASIREAALRHGVPAWNGILSWSHGPYASPTPEQMRWQVWTSLAYGMQGIMYFILWPYPEWKVDNAFPGIVDSGGKPSPIYPEVKQLNHQMRTLGKTLLTLTSTGVYHAGEMPRGSQPVPVDAAVQLPADQPLMVGFFRQDGTADEYAIVVNRDYTKPVECDLSLRSAVQEVQLISATDGLRSPLPITGGKLPLSLAPGEGKLLKLSVKPGNPSPSK